MRKLLFILAAIAAVASMAKGKQAPEALSFSFVDQFTDDATHATYDSASVQMWLAPAEQMLKLCVLPAVGAPLSEALVDTLWMRHSYYQQGANVDNDLFKERNVLYLYTLTPEHYLAGYYVMSQFIDKKHEGLQQIVIRKFNAAGRRMWCANLNADSRQIKEFFEMLAFARKLLKFDRLTSVEGNPAAGGLQRPGDHEGNKMRTGKKIGTGSPLQIGW